MDVDRAFQLDSRLRYILRQIIIVIIRTPFLNYLQKRSISEKYDEEL